MGETLGSPTVSMKLQRIAQQAQRYPAMVFNNVFHLIDRDFLREAYRLTRKNSAPGVDQVTATQYAEHLEDNLWDLHERLRDNRYVAPPVERVWIEKEGGKKRPIGKPCFEDKIVQRAVVMILEAIFEQDFHAFSHGFRKGHSPHQALHELREQCRTLHINWIVDADVSGCFDNLDWGLSAGVYPAESQRWRNPEADRQVAARRRAGSGRADTPGQGHPAGRSCVAPIGQRVLASGLGRMVCQRRAAPDEGPVLCDALCR
jgi:Reverse transcriptase (RNA-dependent DNA polymerase)